MSAATDEYIKLIKHPVKFRLFLLYKLPAAFFSGVRVREISENKCITSVPFKWLTQNPFRSTYFASLAMAAELSTGVLALVQLHKRKPVVSMLVVKLEANYFKKAVGRIKFICEDGLRFREIIEETIAGGESRSLVAKSTGTNEEREKVAEFFITWSFKAKRT